MGVVMREDLDLRCFCVPFGMFARAAFHVAICCAQIAKVSRERFRLYSSKFKRPAFWTCFARGAFKSGFKVRNPFFQFINSCRRGLYAFPHVPTPQKLGYFSEDSHV